MDRGPHPDYSGWVVNHGDPDGKVRMLEQPRRAVVDAHTYAGHRVRLQLYVTVEHPLLARSLPTLQTEPSDSTFMTKAPPQR